MTYNQIPVACTNENAPFQQFDLWWIDQFVSRGIDMPCGMMGAILNFAICGIVLLIVAVILIVWRYQTRDKRGDPLAALARRHARRIKARQKAARIRVNTQRREEKARNLRWAREDRELFERNGWKIVPAV